MFYSGSLDTHHAGKIVKSKVKKKYSLAPTRDTMGRLPGESLSVTLDPMPPVLSPALQQNIWGTLSPAPTLQGPTDLAFPDTLPPLVPGLSSNSLSFPDSHVTPARGGKFAPLPWFFQTKSSKLTHSSETEHWLQPSLPSYSSSPMDPMNLLLSSIASHCFIPAPNPSRHSLLIHRPLLPEWAGRLTADPLLFSFCRYYSQVSSLCLQWNLFQPPCPTHISDGSPKIFLS